MYGGRGEGDGDLVTAQKFQLSWKLRIYLQCKQNIMGSNNKPIRHYQFDLPAN